MNYALTIIVPFLREEKNIEKVLSSLTKSVKNSHEIILVYDNDEDPTISVIKKYIAQYKTKHIFLIKNNIGTKIGVMNALKTGFACAKGRTIVVIMADLADDIRQIDHMYSLILQGNDIVCASRFMKGGKKIGGQLIKTLLSRVACFTLHTFFRIPTHDATNAYKMYRTSLLKDIKIESTGGFEYSLEIIVKAHKKGWKITEIPTVWKDREAGKSHFKLRSWIPHYIKWYLTVLPYRNLLITFSSALFFLVILVFFHFRGIIFYDEGYVLNSALRVAHGEVPYRDFDVNYTPVSFLTTAIFLKLFGESVFAGRLAALTISLFSLFALFTILRLITTNKFIIILCLLFFIAWGPAHINFPWSTMFAACFFFYTTFFYLQGIIQRNRTYFYVAGIMAVVTCFSKQNFGTGLLLVSFFSFLFLDTGRKWSYALSYFYGIVFASSIALIAFLSTSSFIPFMYNNYYHIFQKIVFERLTDTPFLYEGPLLIRFAKLVFYLLPLLLSFLAFFFTRTSEKKLFVIALFTATFYLLGIRPVTDYDHLVGLLAVSGVSLVLIIQYAKNVFITRLFLLILITMTIFGFYTAYFSNYYKWETPLRYQNYFDTNPRLHVFISRESAMAAETLIRYIDTHTKPGEYIFMNHYAPLVYFLADRRNASRYDYILPHAIFPSDQKTTILELQKKQVRLVIMHVFTKNEKTIIADYIRKHYHLDQTIGDYFMYVKNY